MRIGSLFTGYGGLTLAVEEVFGGRTVWTSEFDPQPSKIIEHRFPGVPNHGDITKIDWSQVEPVDILDGGFPCQDLSAAGARKGMQQGTRSGLWSEFVRAIAALRPRYVVIENVRGLLSGRTADSEDVDRVGPKGGRRVEITHRAMGRVLRDLADLGFDAEWCVRRAADVGAPHRRERVFLLATDPRSQAGPVGSGLRPAGSAPFGRTGGRSDDSGDPDLLPTPEASDGTGGRVASEVGGQRPSGSKRSITLATAVHHLLPTPDAASSNAGEDAETWLARREVLKAKKINGNGAGTPLGIAVQLLPTPGASDHKGETRPADRPERPDNGRTRTEADGRLPDAVTLLPTPRASDGPNGGPNQRGSKGDLALPSAVLDRFAQYAPAVARWEPIVGWPAPDPTVIGAKGSPRLNPVFEEWMMGLPEGWVTGVPDLIRKHQMKALGNGVVPQQAISALTHLLERSAR